MKLPLLLALSLSVDGLLVPVGAAAAGSNQAAAGAAQAEFATVCARCHNADGSGAPGLGIPSFIDPHWQGAHSDEELKLAIKNGSAGKMPAFGAAYTADQIDALVRYVVRSFAPKGSAKSSRPRPPEPPPIAIEPRLAPPGHGAGPVVLGNVGVYTQHNDNGRTGANLNETTLTPANVNVRQFGLLFRHAVDDQVFAQPLYVPNLAIAGGRHNVVIVATAANTVYAFDADRDAAPYWKVSLGPPGSVQQHHFWCLDILGNMGIIGTPVIDPGTGTLFVVALTHEGDGFVQRLHALDLATGADRPGSPVVITAEGFDPILENQRPALLLAHGSLYVGYSSHCDVGPYHGFLFRFDPQTLRQLGVLNLSPDGTGNSIWQSGQGPAADENGTLYFVTSNGTWDGRRNFSNSFLKVDSDLQVRDWFTPTNYQELDRRDHDLNSSGAMLLPGTHEVMGAGKEGVIYLIDRADLGHLGDEHAVQHFPAAKAEVNGGAVYWKSAARGGLVYLWGQDDALRVYTFNAGRFDPQPLAVGDATSAYPGGILSLSANGGTDGILWANAALAPHGNGHVNGPGVLRAYDASDIRHELWDSNLDADRDTCGRISKNAPPTIVNGKVYLASFGTLPVGTGALYVYGLLPNPAKSK
ncbi:MAG TPA: c-type cytochrome [Opitutaceae bacterium]|nr:c-type cytochrome [Opitutaceae bacterium]